MTPLDAAREALEQYRRDMLYPNLDADQRERRIEMIRSALALLTPPAGLPESEGGGKDAPIAASNANVSPSETASATSDTPPAGEPADDDLVELESLAKAATPGPWTTTPGTFWICTVGNNGDDPGIWSKAIPGPGVQYPFAAKTADAAHIAAANPVAVLDLITRIRDLTDECRASMAVIAQERERADRAEARVTEMDRENEFRAAAAATLFQDEYGDTGFVGLREYATVRARAEAAESSLALRKMPTLETTAEEREEHSDWGPGNANALLPRLLRDLAALIAHITNGGKDG